MRHRGIDWRRIRAAWALVLLATLCAELTFTAVALPATWLLLPLLLVMYGAGVLLIREMVVRVGGGWPSLVALGLAYELAEDGLGLQALTSPRMYGAADWGFRALGANWTYWASQIGVHVVLSVLIPVTLVGLLFPDLRGRPFLGTGGLVAVGALAVVGVLGLRYVLSAMLDPGYRTPGGWMTVFVIGIVVLFVVALRVLPRFGIPGTVEARRAPHQAVIGVVALCLTMAFLTTVLPLGLGPDLLFGDRTSPVSRLVVGVLVGMVSAWLVVRWTRAENWDDRGRIWLIGGILVAHTAFMMPGSATAMVVGAVTILVEVGLLTALARHVRGRATDPALAR